MSNPVAATAETPGVRGLRPSPTPTPTPTPALAPAPDPAFCWVANRYQHPCAHAHPCPGAYPPRFLDGDSATRQVAENSPAGTAIGEPLTARDPQVSRVNYALEDEHARLFRAGGNAGSHHRGYRNRVCRQIELPGTLQLYFRHSGFRRNPVSSDGIERAWLVAASGFRLSPE